MTRPFYLAAGIVLGFALTGCTTPLSPRTCTQAAAGLTTAGQIAAVLVNAGIEGARAEKLAQAVAAGEMLLSVACAQSEPPA